MADNKPFATSTDTREMTASRTATSMSRLPPHIAESRTWAFRLNLIGAGLRLVVGGFDPFATTWGSAAYSEAPQARSP